MQTEHCWKVMKKLLIFTRFKINFFVGCARHAKQAFLDSPNANLVIAPAQLFARSKLVNVFVHRESQERNAINVFPTHSDLIKLLAVKSVTAINMVFLMEIFSVI